MASPPSASLVKDLEVSGGGTGKNDVQVFSSQRVGDVVFNLVGCTKNGTEGSASSEHSKAPPARIGRGMPNKARKSFSSSFKVPQSGSDPLKLQTEKVEEIKAANLAAKKTLLEEPSHTTSKKQKLGDTSSLQVSQKSSALNLEPSEKAGSMEVDNGTLDPAERKTVLDCMKKSYTSPHVQVNRSAFSESETSSEDMLDGAGKMNRKPASVRKEMPELIQIDVTCGDVTRLGESSRMSPLPTMMTLTPPSASQPVEPESTVQDVVSTPLVQSPPTPAPTPGPPPLLRDEDTMSLEERMAVLHGEPLDKGDNSSTITTGPNMPDKVVSGGSDSGTEPGAGKRLSDQDFSPSQISPEIKKPRKAPTKPKSAPSSGTKVSTVTPKPRSSGNRELDRLYMDEGAEKIYREMAQKGSTSRRSATSTTITPPPPLSRSPRRSTAPIRSQQQEASVDGKKKAVKKSSKATANAKPIPAVPSGSGEQKVGQDPALEQWKALKDSDQDGVKTVYVPRKYANPADASQIIHRRSYSSDSSTTDDAARRLHPSKRTINLPDLSPPEHREKAPALKDHGYTRIEEPSGTDGDAPTKLLSGWSEILVCCVGRHLLHITLNPFLSSSSSSRLVNSLSSTTLQELTSILRKLKTESQIRVVLVTSNGPDFCTGIDLNSLLRDTVAERKEVARHMSNLIQDFIVELANCDKILVSGVKGSAVGLGVTMLRYFDLVYASDKSTFYLPYVKLAQGSEGGAALALQNPPSSKSLFGLLLYEGRRLTATEAKTTGLVDDVLWPATFRGDLMQRVQTFTAQSSETTLLMKKQMRAAFRRKLPAVLKGETELLRESWASDEFQRRAAVMLASGELLA